MGSGHIDSVEDLFFQCASIVKSPPPEFSHVTLTEEQQLHLYARYKQGCEGDNVTPCPGLLDFVARAKWKAWKALMGMDALQAQSEYIDCVQAWFREQSPEMACHASEGLKQAKITSRFQSHRDSRANEHVDDTLLLGSAPFRGIGAIGREGLNSGCVDSPDRTSEEREGDKRDAANEHEDIFSWAKEGFVDKVVAWLDGENEPAEGGEIGPLPRHVDTRDEEGRTLLHWAVDGNHGALVKVLLARGADMTATDKEGDTCLDYARLCEHKELVELLVEREAITQERKTKETSWCQE